MSTTFFRQQNIRVINLLYMGYLIVFVCVLSSCSKREETSHDPFALITEENIYPYSIVVTTGFIYDIVSHIVGEHATIYQVMGAGTDPHTYTPTRSDIVAIYNAPLIIYSGLHLEGNMYTIFNRIIKNKTVFSIATLLEGKISLHEKEDGGFDPHIWMDVRLWYDATLKIAELLAKFDTSHEQEYRTNAESYAQVLIKLDQNIRVLYNTIPNHKRILITSHDAFGYFGSAYGFEVHGIQGISTVAEASLKHISQLIQLIIENNIDAVFVESTVSEKYIQALIEGARDSGHKLKTGGTLFGDAMGLKGSYEGTYIGMVEHNAVTITQALGGSIDTYTPLGLGVLREQ